MFLCNAEMVHGKTITVRGENMPGSGRVEKMYSTELFEASAIVYEREPSAGGLPILCYVQKTIFAYFHLCVIIIHFGSMKLVGTAAAGTELTWSLPPKSTFFV